MIRLLSQVLNAGELQAVRDLLPQVGFGDGRITNQSSQVKRNLQASQEDPVNARIAQLARDALARHPDLRIHAMPRTMARATVVRYEPGMTYGWHVDEALFPSTPPMRSDLSCTIFLNEPTEYDGGELMIQLGAQELAYKLNAATRSCIRPPPSTRWRRSRAACASPRSPGCTAGSRTRTGANCWRSSTKPARSPCAAPPRAIRACRCCWNR
jgi:predicted 2-oxoglutarate/Fe(II)-dependent dioxygenase YbiX